MLGSVTGLVEKLTKDSSIFLALGFRAPQASPWWHSWEVTRPQNGGHLSPGHEALHASQLRADLGEVGWWGIWRGRISSEGPPASTDALATGQPHASRAVLP